ncbi:uncharacterized protein PSANT_05961 [Moesziomyces antarcticus]|uniref:Uncharacterized protein n=1 Tax=Pseudozyma antarctica TaxID=84753 RepID=A0A5C3FVE1_PSEA2|nr:uncharacterized protein PSANT_05961 [Moesziomyces antarcticus]
MARAGPPSPARVKIRAAVRALASFCITVHATRGADEFVRVCSAGQCVDKPLVEGRVPTRRNAQRSQGRHQPAFQSPSSAQHSVTLPSTLIPQSRVGHSISSPHPNHCSPSLRFSIASILYHSASHCCLLHLLTIQDSIDARSVGTVGIPFPSSSFSSSDPQARRTCERCICARTG